MKSLGNSFENNFAIDGGAIFSAGFASVVDSKFEDNAAEIVSLLNCVRHRTEATTQISHNNYS